MKKLLLFAVISMMSMSGNAQSFTDEENDFNGFNPGDWDKRKSMVAVGLKVGANMSSMTKFKEADLGQKSSMGFEVGLVASAHFGKRTKGSDPGTGVLGVQIEPGFVQHAIKTNDETIKLNYFELPILCKIYLTPNFNLEVGPNICGTLSCNPDYVLAENVRIATGKIKGFDVKTCVGASYETKEGLYGSLRYHLGTSELAKNFPCKVSAISLTVGYKFNVFKF